MKEYIYIINGMDYMLNEQPSRHEIPRGSVAQDGETTQGQAQPISALRAVLIAVINLLTR